MNRPRLPFVPAAVLSLLALVPVQAAAQDEGPPQERYGLRLEYREFRPTLTGTVQKGANGEEGSIIDIVDDLGVVDERTFDARLTIKVKTGHKLRAGYMPIDYNGDQRAPRNFTFRNTTFFRDDRVVTSFKGTLWSGDYEWEFYRGEKGFVGALLGARVWDVDTALVNVDLAEREVDTVTTPFPVIGIMGRGYAGKVSVEGEFAGLSLGSTGSYYEFEAAARLHFSDRLAAMGGYRKLSVNAKDDPDLVKFKMGGWQFGLELSL